MPSKTTHLLLNYPYFPHFSNMSDTKSDTDSSVVFIGISQKGSTNIEPSAPNKSPDVVLVAETPPRGPAGAKRAKFFTDFSVPETQIQDLTGK